MSSEWNTKAESQRKQEHGEEHSALFYLLQEVSKLASPVQNRCLDANSSRWLSETSRNSFNNEKEEEEGRSFQACRSSLEDCPTEKDEGECSLHISHSTCQHSLSCMLSYNHIKNVSRESLNSEEFRCDCNSPWKVLSLINLQCDRLIHQTDVEELNTNSLLSATQSKRSTSAASPLNETEREVKTDNVDCSSESLLPRREERELAAFATPVEDLKLHSSGDGHKPLFCVEGVEGCSVLEQMAENRGPDASVLQDDSSAVSLQPLHCYREESGVDEQSEKSQECLSNKNKKMDVLLPEKVLDQTPEPDACLHTCVTFSSNYSECIALSKPAFILDHNANMTLSTEPPCDTCPPPPSAHVLPSQSPLVFNSANSSQSLLEQGDNVTASKLEYSNTPIEEKYSSGCDVSSTTSQPELWMVQTEGTDLPSSHRCRRKQPHPSRSADVQDPGFQGVTFRIDTELDDTREQCRLLITSNYSKEFGKSERKPKLRTRTSQKSPKTSSSDEEDSLTTNTLKGKVCASCCTRKTPMWRHAEDGTPLCNACGIRYKKYRVRCVNCWHIPRKEGNSNSCCLKCGDFVRLHSTQRKHRT